MAPKECQISRLKWVVAVIGITVSFALWQIAISWTYRGFYWDVECPPYPFCSRMPVTTILSESDYHLGLVLSSVVLGFILALALTGAFTSVRHVLRQKHSG